MVGVQTTLNTHVLVPGQLAEAKVRPRRRPRLASGESKMCLSPEAGLGRVANAPSVHGRARANRRIVARLRLGSGEPRLLRSGLLGLRWAAAWLHVGLETV